MPKKKYADENEIANSIMHQVIQSAETNPAKNPAAVALGRMGGKKGGPARAKKLSSEQRKAIAKKAADSRWKK